MHLLLAASLALSAVQRARIDAIVERVTQERHVAGLSLGIARRGQRLYLRGYGLRDVLGAKRADGYTIYRVGSIAKQFAAALVLKEVAAGRIALSDSANRYLSAGTRDATVGQLLNQTSGIAGLSAAGTAQFAFAPGSGWLYSNANYALLGTLLATVTGATYPSLLHAHITAPLGLLSTGCGRAMFGDNSAAGYTWRDGRWANTPDGTSANGECSAFGLYSNAADLLRWLEALRSSRVVPTDSLAAMTRSGRLAGGIATHYGYGFFLAGWYGYDVAEHSGYVAGFSSEDALVLEDGLEVALLTNADAVDLTPLLESIIAALDSPRAAPLAVEAQAPAENEDLRVTASLRALLQTQGFAAYGSLRSLEFIWRTVAAGVVRDRYRVTFSSGQWWADVGYRSTGAVESLLLTPLQ